MKHQEWEPQATYDQPKEETTRQDTAPPYSIPKQLHQERMNGWEFLQWLLSGIGEGISTVWEWLIDDDGWIWVAILLLTILAMFAGIFHWMK